MARDSAQEKRDNLNRGIPKQNGLDEDTRNALLRSAGPKDGGVAVGSFRDLQLGQTEGPPIERPLNPNQDPGEVVDISEHMATEGVVSAGASGESFDDFTVEELKDELAAKGKPVSGTKAELIARLEGRE